MLDFFILVYLQTSPEVVHRRIIERSQAEGGRKEEATIPLVRHHYYNYKC